MNILEQANEIIFKRAEEKERQYGPFEEGMLRASQIASGMTGKTLSAKDVYSCIIAIKLSRESYTHKEDNILDAIAYLASLNELEKQNNKQS